MTTQDTGTVRVFTYKDRGGMLSPMAHDLRFTVERFTVRADGRDVEARFEPQSMRVDGTMRDGTLDPGGLNEMFRREVLKNAHDEVLQAGRHREIVFRGRAEPTPEGWRVDGELTLVGRTDRVTVTARRAGDRLAGRVELTPSRWGIKPFKAMLGTLRLQDRVTIEFDIPEPAGG